MARKNGNSDNRGLPVAPHEVSRWRTGMLRRWGRRDARKYENLRDYTHTHAVIWMDEIAKTGQSAVNLWYSTQCEPLLAGNERIHVEIGLLEAEIEAVKQLVGNTGRERARIAKELARLNHDVMNREAQRRTNRARGQLYRRHAEEALVTWQTYRDLMASIYARARVIRSADEVASSRAEIPPYQPIQLKIIPQFEEDMVDEFAPEPSPNSPRVVTDERITKPPATRTYGAAGVSTGSTGGGAGSTSSRAGSTGGAR